MMGLLRRLDGFTLLLLTVIVAATVWPAGGGLAEGLSQLSTLAVAVLFALCGAVLDACAGAGRRGDIGGARVVLAPPAVAPQPQPELGRQVGEKYIRA